jgi:hypothetical protein
MLALHSQIHPVAWNISDPHTFLVAPAASDFFGGILMLRRTLAYTYIVLAPTRSEIFFGGKD